MKSPINRRKFVLLSSSALIPISGCTGTDKSIRRTCEITPKPTNIGGGIKIDSLSINPKKPNDKWIGNLEVLLKVGEKTKRAKLYSPNGELLDSEKNRSGSIKLEKKISPLPELEKEYKVEVLQEEGVKKFSINLSCKDKQ